MKRKIVVWMGLLLYTVLFASAKADADAFAQLYLHSGMKAFLADGRLLFEQCNTAEQTFSMVCTGEDGQTIWETEIPDSEYGGSMLGQAGEDILYACRRPGDPYVTLARYSQEGRLLSTLMLPEDAGRHVLVSDRIYFISEGALKACDAEGKIETVTDGLGDCKSLYEAEGNDAAHAFHIRVEKDGESKHVLVVLNQEQGGYWTYDLGDVDITDSRRRLAVSPQGHVSMAYIEGNRTLCIKSFEETGNATGRMQIDFPEGSGSFISQMRMSAPNRTQVWGSYDLSGERKSWKATLDPTGDALQVDEYPQWVDFVSYQQGDIYGIVDPLGSPVLQREDALEWHAMHGVFVNK